MMNSIEVDGKMERAGRATASGSWTGAEGRPLRRLVRPSPMAVLLVAIIAPFVFSSSLTLPLQFPVNAWLPVANLALIAVIGAVAFDLLVAYTGQLSFAHAAFLMLGTAVGGVLGVKQDISLIYVLAAALAAGAIVGAVVGLPALRLRGLYLALATLAIYFFFFRGYQLFQRHMFGFSGILFPPAEAGVSPKNGSRVALTLNSDLRWYWFLLVVAGLSLWFMRNVVASRAGRRFAAVRHHDLNAALLGVNVTRTKLTAFAVSSAFVTMSGVLLSYYLSARDATSYSIDDTLRYAAIVVVGGLSSNAGAMLGSLFYYALPVLISWAIATFPGAWSSGFLSTNQSAVQLGVFGLAIVFVLVFFPEGLMGVVHRVRRRLDAALSRGRDGSGPRKRRHRDHAVVE